jgi:CheY-like chemotaxis protein
MDIKMPIMNGVEALAEIKKTYPKLPVIAQTAFARPEEIEDYLNMGFDGYLTKPIRVNDLVSTVRQFM